MLSGPDQLPRVAVSVALPLRRPGDDGRRRVEHGRRRHRRARSARRTGGAVRVGRGDEQPDLRALVGERQRVGAVGLPDDVRPRLTAVGRALPLARERVPDPVPVTVAGDRELDGTLRGAGEGRRA